MAFYYQGGCFLLFPLPRAHGGKPRPVTVSQKKTWGVRELEARAGPGVARGSAGRGSADRRPSKLWRPRLRSSPLGYNKSEDSCQGGLGECGDREEAAPRRLKPHRAPNARCTEPVEKRQAPTSFLSPRLPACRSPEKGNCISVGVWH